MVSPGAALLELADLDHLTLTVYVPENRYGQVALGEPVTVAVDSFPGRDVHGHRQAHRRPGRVHAAQRPDGRGPHVDGVRRRARARPVRRQAQARDAGRRDVRVVTGPPPSAARQPRAAAMRPPASCRRPRPPSRVRRRPGGRRRRPGRPPGRGLRARRSRRGRQDHDPAPARGRAAARRGHASVVGGHDMSAEPDVARSRHRLPRPAVLACTAT